MAHIHELIDYTVEVFIVHKDRVLLRMHDKYGYWLSIGGHVELDEDPTEAARREVKEEVGLDVALWDPRSEDVSDDIYKELTPPVSLARQKAIHPETDKHEHVVLVYFAIAESDDVKVIHEGDRSDEWRWVSAEELDSMDLRHNVRAYARRALEILGKSS